MTAVAAPPRPSVAPPRPRTSPAPESAPVGAPAPQQQPASTGGGDPWSDPRWVGVKWTVYRGTAYDLTAFMDRHPVRWRGLRRLRMPRPCWRMWLPERAAAPVLAALSPAPHQPPLNPPHPAAQAGSWLLNLALGRDCTALFESYHLRPEVGGAGLAWQGKACRCRCRRLQGCGMPAPHPHLRPALPTFRWRWPACACCPCWPTSPWTRCRGRPTPTILRSTAPSGEGPCSWCWSRCIAAASGGPPLLVCPRAAAAPPRRRGCKRRPF